MATEREKIFQKFCKESKSLNEAFEKMKEYDRKYTPALSNIYIDTNNEEADKYMASQRKNRVKEK